MKIMGSAQRVRIFIGESDRYHHQPLYHAIVLKAREMGMAGATVCRAFEGFGASTRIRSANLLDLSADLPVVVEIVDGQEYVERFLPVLDQMVDKGLITVDPVQVVKYAHDGSGGTPLHLDPDQSMRETADRDG
jgi:PII-like signaling protein